MGQTVRQAMAYLHTWLGLVLGFVLMACFFFGALSVFDREIDRWSIPETRAIASPLRAVDEMLPALVAGLRPDPDSMEQAAAEVIGRLPPADSLALSDFTIVTNHRDPMVRVFGTFDLPNKPRSAAEDHAHVHGSATLDPATGKRLPPSLEDRLALGTGFFYPLHFSLHLEWRNLGIWIVGLAGMAMLAALVSGVVMHRRIFREFFTFRPDKARLRSTLDLHNMTGVLALPFLFVITFSGLLIFAETYLPSNKGLMLPFVKAQEALEKARIGLPDKPAGQLGTLASVDAMMTAAKVRWAAQGVPGEVGSITIFHVGDANAYVAVARDQVDRVATVETLYFKGSTGELVYEKPPEGAVSAINGFLTGLHFQFFQHWGLRWLLFAGGLMGCACITTGFLFFVEKRKRAHAASGHPGMRIVNALAVASVTGMLAATVAMMLANQLLPVDWPKHDLWQKGVFWLAWAVALLHASLRSASVTSGGTSPAWAEQAWAAAALALSAVIANAVTTGDHLIRTLSTGYWPVAGIDLVLLAGASAAAWSAHRLGRQSAVSLETQYLCEQAGGAARV